MTTLMWILIALVAWLALSIILGPLVGRFLHDCAQRDTFAEEHAYRDRLGLEEFEAERRARVERAMARHKSRAS